MDELLIQPFRRLLGDVCQPSVVRQEEQKAGTAALWADLEASGFLDALVPEEQGGAGLTISEVFPLIVACGSFALPAPVGETMVARAMLVARGVRPPVDAAIVLAPTSTITPLAGKASHALVSGDGSLALLALDHGQPDPFGAGGLSGTLGGQVVLEVQAGPEDLLVCAASLTAARMVGAMGHIFDMTINYANEREQFGRSLGKFQAIQHQLAVAAEELVAAHSAARIGMSGTMFDRLRCAVAKARVGQAAEALCTIAHAVHGAIGVTEEYDLQLHTRRLKQGQLAFGSKTFWASILGEARINAGLGTSADFVRSHLEEEA